MDDRPSAPLKLKKLSVVVMTGHQNPKDHSPFSSFLKASNQKKGGDDDLDFEDGC